MKRPRRKHPGLTPRHARFVAEYLKDLNAAKAYIRSGYSHKHAESHASRLAANGKVAAAIAAGIAVQLAKADLSASRTLEELRRVAFSNIKVFFDQRGHLRGVRELSDADASVLAATKVLKTNLVSGDGRREEVHEIKLWDKLKALEMLAKYFKLLEEQIHVTADWDKIVARLASARARVKE